MRRRVLNLVTVLSLLLCVAMTALWVRSHVNDDYLGWHSWTFDRVRPENNLTRVVGVGWSNGTAVIGDVRVLQYGPLAQPVLGSSGWFVNGPQGQEWPLNTMAGAAAESYGFHLFRMDYPPTPGFVGERGWGVTVPLWALATPAAVLPTAWVFRRLRRRRFNRPGHCGRCGYDLRGTPERCPECGEVT